MNIDLTNTQDVAFFDQGNPGTEIFSNATIMKVTVRETIRTMQHPLENGQIVADYKIINPRELDVSIIISSQYYSETYNEIKQYFNNSTLLGFSARTGYITNLIVADAPHEETADMFDVITMAIHLKEVLFVPAPAPYDPVTPATATSSRGGGITGITAPPSAATAANIQSTTQSGQQTAESLSNLNVTTTYPGAW